jgi:hypothetical protein
MILATVAAISAGCDTGSAIRNKTTIAPGAKPVILEANREELLEAYNVVARGVKTLNATVELKPTAGSKYSGVIDEYHEVKAFLLASRPADIRVIGQVPVIGTTVFDMASDGDNFQVSIPTKNKFLVGPVAVERASAKPIENLRPQHLLDALLWPEIRKEEVVLFEEFNDEKARYYLLTELRGGYQTETLRKIWFDRANLKVVRLQSFGPKGFLLSDTHFADWEAVDPWSSPAGQTVPPGPVTAFPHTIRVERPHDDYLLDLQVARITLNEDLPADRFKLERPQGSELVQVNSASETKQP